MGGTPINSAKKGCNPISSECVVWQGPDIACIDLCKGDTISDVVYKLAVELCQLMETFNLDNYDLTCLTDCPKPSNFQQLIQLLIAKICELQDCCDSQTPVSTNGCPDCIVNIAPCFYYQNPQGDTVTTMQLIDYVTAIGNRICTIVDEIDIINQTLAQFNQRIAALEADQQAARQRSLETTTELLPVCIANPNNLISIPEFLSLLEDQFCQLRSATGLPNDLFKSILTQCAGLSMEKALSSGINSMGSLQGWSENPANVADALNNLWLTICDMRAAVKTIKANCCGDGCDDVNVVLFATLSGNTLSLYFTGSIPFGFEECSSAGTVVTVRDTAGNSFKINVSLTNLINSPSGIQIDLSTSALNTALDFMIDAAICVKNEETSVTCNTDIQYYLPNSVPCPDPLNLNSTDSSIAYSFNHVTGDVTYTVELYDGSGTILLSSNSHVVSGPATVSGTFGGLTSGTVYRIRVKAASGSKTNTCPFVITSTTGSPCDPPSNVSAVITT